MGLKRDTPMMYSPFLVTFPVRLWLFLAMFTIRLSVLLWKGRLLTTRFGNPQVENHVIKAKEGSRAATKAAYEDRNDGGQCGSRYDVFLSFRGRDTRFDLADVLYIFMRWPGIHVFREYEELQCGEEIAGEIRQAIYDSKIYIVIFSRTYAWSSWCLCELAMIAKCCIDSDENEKIIIPVFHRVDPADVKLKTGLYQEAIDWHRIQYKADMVQEWEVTLKTVAKIRGWVSTSIQG